MHECQVISLSLQLLEVLKFYARFEINEDTGNPLTDHDMTQLHYEKITSLQVRGSAAEPQSGSAAS